jgi:hypothetical protein
MGYSKIGSPGEIGLVQSFITAIPERWSFVRETPKTGLVHQTISTGTCSESARGE